MNSCFGSPMLKRTLSCSFVLLALFASECRALADYYLPPAKKTWMLLTDNWKIKNTSPGINQVKMLAVNHAGKTYSFPIEKMWLADRINSDSICVGTHSALMDEYLAELEASARNLPLMIELVEVKAPSRFVAGLWLFNVDSVFDREAHYGAHRFNLSADQVKKLGKHGYEKKVREVSDKNWSEVSVAAE